MQVVNGTNLVCALAQATADRVLGDGDGRGGAMPGDVVGARAIAKLRALTTGELAAAAAPTAAAQQGGSNNSSSPGKSSNSELWALPRGARVPPLAAPCPPIVVGGGGDIQPATAGPAAAPAPQPVKRPTAHHRRLLEAADLAA